MKDMNKWIVVVVMLVASCAKQEHEILRLQSPLPSGILAKDEPIIITFSKAVVPAESTNQWTNTQYIEFVPEIPGKFTWRDTSTLIFSPDGPYTGDAKFNGTLNTALLLKLARASKFDGDRTFTFNTESFRLTGAEFFYDRIGQSRTVGIKANLEFTYAANPAEVVRHMKVAIDDQQPQVIASSSQNASVIPVEMGTTRQLELEKHITITFDEELISPETKTHLIAGKPFVYTLPGLEETKIYGHEYSTDGKTVTIIFRTSQAIDLATAKKYISLDPAKEYTVEGGGQQIILKANFEPGSTFHVRIRKGMESVLGGKTQNEYEADIVVGNVRPSFSFASPEGIYMLLSGRRSVDIKSINLSKVAVRVSQIFQNNLVAFLNQGRSYDYSYGYNDEYNDDDEGEGIHPYRRKYR